MLGVRFENGIRGLRSVTPLAAIEEARFSELVMLLGFLQRSHLEFLSAAVVELEINLQSLPRVVLNP